MIKGIAGKVYELINETVTTLGYEIWDVEYLKEGADWILRVTIDQPDGIGIDDCEKVHRAIDPILDEADPIENSYDLEVSSPGLERELKMQAHFEKYIGTKVTCGLYVAKDGSKQLTGILKSYDDGNIEIETDKGIIPIGKKEYNKVETKFDFESTKGKKKKF